MIQRSTVVLVVLLICCSLAMSHVRAGAATVIIHDGASSVVKAKAECDTTVNGADCEAVGCYVKHGGPDYNIWLYGGGGDPPTCSGYITDTSTVATEAVYVQFHLSDGNDGVSDIYVDDMDTPVVRIDTYNRGNWYVEIRDLPNTTHIVRVRASANTDWTGVVPSPHRETPTADDNDVWYIGYGPAETVDLPAVSYGGVVLGVLLVLTCAVLLARRRLFSRA